MPVELPVLTKDQEPLTREEEKQYEVLMSKATKSLREEAKRADLAAGAKTKAMLAYNMVKGKKPGQQTNSSKKKGKEKKRKTSEDPPPSPGFKGKGPGFKGKGPGGRCGTPCLSPRGITSNPQQQPFPPNLSPAQLLVAAETGANLFENGLVEDDSNRPGSAHRASKDKLKELVACAPTAPQFVNGSSEQRGDAMPDHCHQHTTILDSNTLSRGPKQSRDDEAEGACPMPRLHRSLLHHEPISVQSVARYTLVPVQHWSPTSEHLSSYSTLYEGHGSDLLPLRTGPPEEDRILLAPITGRSEEGRTLPPIREALDTFLWLDPPEAVPPFPHFQRTNDPIFR